MDEIVKELRRIVPFKATTAEGDLVLIAMEKQKSVLYAIVSEISRDETKKAEWWQVTMHLLTVPPQKVTWTLREPQFTGAEIFTMGDDGRFIQAVNLADDVHRPPAPPKPERPKKAALSSVKNPKPSSLRLVK